MPILHREEIIGRRSGIAGYRFAVLSLGPEDQTDATAQAALLATEAIANLAQRRLALIPVNSRDWLDADFRPLIGPGTTFLLAPPATGDSREQWLEIAQAIRNSGARLALTLASTAIPSAVPLADLLVLDFSDYELAGFERLVTKIRSRLPQLALAVEHVQTWPEYRLCQSLGIEYCLGAFSIQIDKDDDSRLGQNRLVLLELLKLLRQEADPAKLAAVAKRDPAVIIHLLALVNSPAIGVGTPISSITKAIMVLGHDELYRWLSIALFQTGGSPRDETLLELSLYRARFLELLAAGRYLNQEMDELFLVGLLSKADALLGLSHAAIVERIRPPLAVADALVRSEGPHARFLALVSALERGRGDQVARLANLMQIDAAHLNGASVAARQWADNVVASVTPVTSPLRAA